jgi:hypothetical protein
MLIENLLVHFVNIQPWVRLTRLISLGAAGEIVIHIYDHLVDDRNGV